MTSAGFTENFKAEDYPYDRMQKLWGVNVNGTYLCAVEIAKHMIERKSGGSMVFIGSMSGSVVNIPQPQVSFFFFSEKRKRKRKETGSCAFLFPIGRDAER